MVTGLGCGPGGSKKEPKKDIFQQVLSFLHPDLGLKMNENFSLLQLEDHACHVSSCQIRCFSKQRGWRRCAENWADWRVLGIFNKKKQFLWRHFLKSGIFFSRSHLQSCQVYSRSKKQFQTYNRKKNVHYSVII